MRFFQKQMGYQSLVLTIFLFCTFASSTWGASRFVAPLHADATDEGVGSPAKPYKTIAIAMAHLMPGDTLNIAAGSYRESLIFPKRAWSTDKPTTITGTGEVTLLGSELVAGWQSRGQDIYVKRPWILEPQQVIINGAMLKQIGGTIFKGYPTLPKHELASLHQSQGGIWPKRIDGNSESMPAESFFYDSAKNELLIRTTDKSATETGVEISMRPFLVHGQNVAGVTVKNIRFRYSNTTTNSRQGAVTLIGEGNTLDGLVVEDMDGAGIEVSGDSNVVRNCVVIRSGYLGVKARGKQVTIENNDISFNNTRRFNKWWEAGGLKFVGGGGLQASKVANNRVHHNYGDGIWFDWGNDSNVVERNVSAFNEGFGIHYEASSNALIQDNWVFGNVQRGIYLIHSRNSSVFHNLIAFNGLEGVAIIDEQRSDPKGVLDLRPANNRVVRNIFAWNKGLPLILPGAEYKNLANENLYVFDKVASQFSMGWPRGPFAKKQLSEWRKAFGQDTNSVDVQLSPNPTLQKSMDEGNIKPNWTTLLSLKGKVTTTSIALENVQSSNLPLDNRVGPR